MTYLYKNFKNKKIVTEIEELKNTDMQEAPIKKDRILTYNIYTDEDHLRYSYFIQETLLKQSEAAKLANINYKAARKWKTSFNKDPEQNVLCKKNRTSNRPQSKLDERRREHLVYLFDENPSAVIQDTVENLTKSFEGLKIKKKQSL